MLRLQPTEITLTHSEVVAAKRKIDFRRLGILPIYDNFFEPVCDELQDDPQRTFAPKLRRGPARRRDDAVVTVNDRRQQFASAASSESDDVVYEHEATHRSTYDNTVDSYDDDDDDDDDDNDPMARSEAGYEGMATTIDSMPHDMSTNDVRSFSENYGLCSVDSKAIAAQCSRHEIHQRSTSDPLWKTDVHNPRFPALRSADSEWTAETDWLLHEANPSINAVDTLFGPVLNASPIEPCDEVGSPGFASSHRRHASLPTRIAGLSLYESQLDGNASTMPLQQSLMMLQPIEEPFEALNTSLAEYPSDRLISPTVNPTSVRLDAHQSMSMVAAYRGGQASGATSSSSADSEHTPRPNFIGSDTGHLRRSAIFTSSIQRPRRAYPQSRRARTAQGDSSESAGTVHWHPEVVQHVPRSSGQNSDFSTSDMSDPSANDVEPSSPRNGARDGRRENQVAFTRASGRPRSDSITAEGSASYDRSRTWRSSESSNRSSQVGQGSSQFSNEQENHDEVAWLANAIRTYEARRRRAGGITQDGGILTGGVRRRHDTEDSMENTPPSAVPWARFL